LCSTVAGCAIGAPIATLGASNIQEGLTGEDGFARDVFQSVLGERTGDLTFGVVNLGTSIGGLARPVLKTSARPLFRTIPSDFEPAYRHGSFHCGASSSGRPARITCSTTR
jgi:type VI secretion system secreted protein VgrG